MALNRSYPAATLMETLVAMVMMAALFSLGVLFFDRLWRLGTSERSLIGLHWVQEGQTDPQLLEAVDAGQMDCIVDTVSLHAPEGWHVQRVLALGAGGDTIATSQTVIVIYEE